VAEVLPAVLRTCPSPSRAHYERYLRRLAAFAGERRLDELTALDLEGWCSEVRLRAATDVRSRGGYSAEEHFLTATRFLFRWALRSRLVRHDPTEGVRIPGRRRSRRRALTQAEIEALFDAIIGSSDDPELCELILALVRETAARREGVLNARRSLLNPVVPSIVLDEKNDQTREMPITRALAEALLAHGAARHPGCDRLLHFRSGACLTSRRFDSMFRRAQNELPWARAMGVSIHWLRHCTLTDVDRVAGTRVAASYAGHADDSTVTDRYTKASFEERQAVHRRLFGDL
jgi:integrase/recombinase XerC